VVVEADVDYDEPGEPKTVQTRRSGRISSSALGRIRTCAHGSGGHQHIAAQRLVGVGAAMPAN
jgi:hypothetical protein